MIRLKKRFVKLQEKTPYITQGQISTEIENIRKENARFLRTVSAMRSENILKIILKNYGMDFTSYVEGLIPAYSVNEVVPYFSAIANIHKNIYIAGEIDLSKCLYEMEKMSNISRSATIKSYKAHDEGSFQKKVLLELDQGFTVGIPVSINSFREYIVYEWIAFLIGLVPQMFESICLQKAKLLFFSVVSVLRIDGIVNLEYDKKRREISDKDIAACLKESIYHIDIELFNTTKQMFGLTYANGLGSTRFHVLLHHKMDILALQDYSIADALNIIEGIDRDFLVQAVERLITHPEKYVIQ